MNFSTLMRNLLTIVGPGLMAALLAGCAGTSSSSSSLSKEIASVPASPQILRIGITPTMPPMIFKEKDQYMGVEADLARRLASSMGRQARFIEVPWEMQIPALLNGQIDIIMSSMSITSARQVRVQFCDPYLQSGQTALVHREEMAKFNLMLGNEKYRVGVQKGTTGDFFAQQYLPTSERVLFDNANDGANALVRKKIDLLIQDAPVNWWLASVNENAGLTVLPQLLTQERLAWGIRREDQGLLTEANRFLAQAKADGTLQAIVGHWIPAFSGK